MLVSHPHRFIYTKTFKTGGTSVESYFERFCMPSELWTASHARDEFVSDFGIVGFRGAKPPETCNYWNHMPAALIRERVGTEVWDKYFKFCVIRNPYDKVVSAFYFFQRANNPSIAFMDLDHDRAAFELWLMNDSQLPLDTDKYMIDGKFCLDAIVRYETLAADLESICVRLSLPWDLSSLPTYKAGMRPKYARTDKLYTNKSRKIVEAAFSFELEYFKYSFPNDDLPN